jgi:hypothetical protein
VSSCCGSLKEAVLNELVTQLVEQRPFKAWVVGSIPTELTTQAALPGPNPHNQLCFLDSQTQTGRLIWRCDARQSPIHRRPSEMTGQIVHSLTLTSS